MTVDELAEVAAQLYASPLAEFVTRRNAQAEATAERELAERIRALRKPTTAAWIVNVFARERSERLGEALQLAEELREAQADLDAVTLAKLGRQRRALTQRLAQEAVSLAERSGHQVTESTLAAVQQTLAAAFFAPGAAAAVASGRLVRELEPGGEFAGELDAIVGGGRPEQKQAAVPPDEVQARRVRRVAERAVQAAQAELARVHREQEELEGKRRELMERVQRLAGRATELESELGRIRGEHERVAGALDGMSGKQADTANRVEIAEENLAVATRQLQEISGSARRNG